MPVKELIAAIQGPVPESVKEVAKGLVYRDFMTVGLLLKKLAVKDARNKVSTMVPDNWIYIQESDVRVGRLQIFNNWSPYLVAQVDQVWIGLEYFCNEGDDLWTMDDGALKEFAIDELVKLSMIAKEDVIDATVIRSPKAYPAYFGTYDRFDEITNYTNSIKNLYLIGRNGMHKYNNQDHSMLAAMTLVDNLLENSESKENIWQVNTEKEYHELKQQKQV
jgi:protoporphyrinogen oxidase